MPSIKVTALACLALFLGARADYYIDPNSVPAAIKASWCSSQVAVCPLICTQLPGNSATTKDNTCNPTLLTYSCICGNGLVPNASEYSQTLPFFLCQQWGQQCVTGCGGNTACQSSCLQDHPCGAQDPTRINATSSSSTSAAAATGTGTDSGSAPTSGGINGFATATPAPTSSTKSGAQAALNLGQTYGLAVVLTGFFALLV